MGRKAPRTAVRGAICVLEQLISFCYSTAMEFFLFLLAVYLGLIVGVSWWVGRGESEEDFLIAGRNRPWWQIAFSKYAVNIGAAWYVTYTALSYEYGFSIIALLIGLVAGYVIFALTSAHRIKRLSMAGGGFYTIGEFVKARTGSLHAGRLVVAVVLVATVLYLTLGVVAGGVIVESFGVISYEIAILLTFLVVVGYVLFSGYKAVVLTDVIQGVVMFVLLVLITYGLVNATDLPLIEAFSFRSIDWLTVLVFTVLGVGLAYAAPDRYQLSYAGKDENSIRLGLLAALVPVAATAAALLVIGTVMYVLEPSISPSLVFAEALSKFLAPEYAPYALVMFFAGLMSSADTQIYVLASHIQFFRQRAITQRSLRKLVFTVGCAGLVLAVLFRDVIDLTILATGVSVSIAFPMMWLVFRPLKGTRFLLIIYGGIFGIVLGLSYYGLDPRAAAFVWLGNIIGCFFPMFIVRGFRAAFVAKGR